jgi:ClpP class serine protease
VSLNPALRAYTTITSTDWAMTQEYLDLMVAVALRENDPIGVVERKLGRRLENSREVTVRDGVATIPVLGPIFRYADFFTMISGGATVETLAQDLDAALGDATISSIVLYIDSPGGEVNGMNELANMVYAARGQKPITAYVSYLGASGAYWLASAASRIVVDATAMVGSIGVVTAMRDPSKAPSRDIEFVSSQSPYKRVDPTTDTGRQSIQARIDRLASVFIETIARNRGASADQVVERFGRGGLLVGADAVAAGMADALGSYEGVLTSLTTPPRGSLFALPSIAAGVAAQSTKETVMEFDEKTAVAETAELDQLRQQLAAEREKRISAEAAAFAEARIGEHKLLPGERAAITELYTAIARDDADRPRAAGPRVTLLANVFAARPAHILTSEAVPASEQAAATVVTNRAETPTGPAVEQARLDEEAAANARAYAARRNGSVRK